MIRNYPQIGNINAKNYKFPIFSLHACTSKIACIKLKHFMYTVMTDTPPILGVGRYYAILLTITTNYRHLGRKSPQMTQSTKTIPAWCYFYHRIWVDLEKVYSNNR